MPPAPIAVPPLSDTIVALASGASPAPRALIRISGDDLAPILFALRLTPARIAPAPAPAPRRTRPHLVRARIPLPVGSLPALALHFPAPRSFTGQHVLELLIPGSPALVDRVLEALLRLPGVRLAQPGEFTARAFLLGKMDLSAAEGLAASIAAHSADELAHAHAVLSGRAGERYVAWREDLLSILALVEAGIDFTDQEDVVAISPASAAERAETIIRAIRDHLAAATGRERPARVPRIALLGPPSAGKSTLFNTLLARDRALTDALPGTTRDALAEPLRLIGPPPRSRTLDIELIDLPGLDTAPADDLSTHAQQHAIDIARDADLILLCDEQCRFDTSSLAGTRARLLRIRTKADRPVPSPPRAPSSSPAPDAHVCALSPASLAAFRITLLDYLWPLLARPSPLDLLPRHRDALLATADTLADATAPAAIASPELMADALRAALDTLATLTGRVERDEVLGRIFASFCVGK